MRPTIAARRHCLILVLIILALIRPTYATDVGLPKIAVILVDGLPASALTPETMPNLDALSKTDRATRWREGRAVMPSVTNANHASLLTGTYPEAHGITGNYFWPRDGSPRAEPLDRPDALDVETIFTIVERRAASARDRVDHRKGKARTTLRRVAAVSVLARLSLERRDTGRIRHRRAARHRRANDDRSASCPWSGEARSSLHRPSRGRSRFPCIGASEPRGEAGHRRRRSRDWPFRRLSSEEWFVVRHDRFRDRRPRIRRL